MAVPDQRSLERLLDAAGQAVRPTHPGWRTLPQRLARTKQLSRRPTWWLGPLSIAAAALFLTIWLGKFTAPTLAEGPIEVRPLDVSLTILSVSETEGETLYMPILQKLGAHLVPPPSLSMAAGAMPPSAGRIDRILPPQRVHKLTGQALVKDHRLILNLKEGDNIVRFTDVAATIDPTSVSFASDTDPAGTEVVEQNFEYDLANADALLKRYLDRKMVCIAKHGEEATGYLASFDDKAIVLASAPSPLPGSPQQRETQTLTRAELQAVRMEEMPKDLLVKPTLVWKLRTRKPGKHDTTLSYLCGFIKWQADYVALIRPGTNNQPDVFDLTGWVTVDNTSGATYDKAGLKLIAGAVNRKRDPWAVPEIEEETMWETRTGKQAASANGAISRKEFVEKSFFEYHLYTLSAPSTLRDKQVKQLNLLERKGIKATRRYVYDPQMDPGRVDIELLTKNEKENNLGLPLPKGKVTLQQRDDDGETAFLGRAEVDHTAVKEELAVRFGRAFDVTGGHRQVSHQQLAPNRYVVTQEMTVRNHKTEEINVRAVARLGLNWTITQSDLPYQSHDVNTVYFDFKLKPNAEQKIAYTVDYQN
jgi:hypothetical protein